LVVDFFLGFLLAAFVRFPTADFDFLDFLVFLAAVLVARTGAFFDLVFLAPVFLALVLAAAWFTAATAFLIRLGVLFLIASLAPSASSHRLKPVPLQRLRQHR
jgi:hypothetical protein